MIQSLPRGRTAAGDGGVDPCTVTGLSPGEAQGRLRRFMGTSPAHGPVAAFDIYILKSSVKQKSLVLQSFY